MRFSLTNSISLYFITRGGRRIRSDRVMDFVVEDIVRAAVEPAQVDNVESFFKNVTLAAV